jgi:hypothetical protein
MYPARTGDVAHGTRYRLSSSEREEEGNGAVTLARPAPPAVVARLLEFDRAEAIAAGVEACEVVEGRVDVLGDEPVPALPVGFEVVVDGGDLPYVRPA